MDNNKLNVNPATYGSVVCYQIGRRSLTATADGKNVKCPGRHQYKYGFGVNFTQYVSNLSKLVMRPEKATIFGLEKIAPCNGVRFTSDIQSVNVFTDFLNIFL